MKTKNLVILEKEEEVSLISLNDEGSFNSLSVDLLNELFIVLKEADDDDSTKTLILRGLGRGFSAGHNLKEIRENQDESFYRNLLTCSRKVMTVLSNLSKPVIAEAHGVATAAGCQLVAACDLAYADTETMFATPGVNIGIFCHTPLVPVSRTIAKKHSMEMLLLGEMIGASEAKRFGLINDIFEPKELHDRVMAIAKTISSKSSYILEMGKETFYKQLNMDLEEAYEYTTERMIKNLKADDAKEGINAFVNKRDPKWKNS
ncbi:MAG: enoyl-CoA hydratase [Pseudomonadota bacterium]|nr:enoyl-CoA hydratase [Pseudomonadota bacterium]MEE3294775.1 enoyl-CoA hydratase [Pseudomonadota bacterium]